MKNFSISLIIITFLAFLFYQSQKSSEFQVLEIKTPTQIAIDLNKNAIEDENETITFENLQTFKIKPDEAQKQLAKTLKISDEDAIGIGFLTQGFVKSTLADKKVKLNKNNTIIYIDGKNYQDLLINKGLALEKGKPPSKPFWKNLEKVRKLNLVILNNKNHKFHKLTCKYGLIAHNAQIIPLSQLPNDAKPCKFCHEHLKKENKEQEAGKRKIIFDEEIPNIKSPATFLQIGIFKVFLTDFTRTFKPSNTCNTQVCKTLVSEINSAQNSIDFAIYGYTKVPAIQKALENAQNRGVKVRFVYDLDKQGTNIYPDTNYLAKILTNNNHDNDNSIMHDKFFIFDGKKVMTGSANISNTDMSGYNSNAIILIDSVEIAQLYEKEFEQMFSGKFHNRKTSTVIARQKLAAEQNISTEAISNANIINVYFSPKDKALTTKVIPLIEDAQKYIYIPAFLITHKELAQSLVQAQKRGVQVKIILDATNTHDGSHSKIKMLRDSGIKVKTEIFAGKCHSKSIIIDDLYTVIGSMNFSKSGEGKNDENLVIIKDEQIARFYKEFFLYLWQRIPDKWLYKNARAEAPESIGSCTDGIDNDFDGKIDKADDSCKIRLNKL